MELTKTKPVCDTVISSSLLRQMSYESFSLLNRLWTTSARRHHMLYVICIDVWSSGLVRNKNNKNNKLLQHNPQRNLFNICRHYFFQLIVHYLLIYRHIINMRNFWHNLIYNFSLSPSCSWRIFTFNHWTNNNCYIFVQCNDFTLRSPIIITIQFKLIQ